MEEPQPHDSQNGIIKTSDYRYNTSTSLQHTSCSTLSQVSTEIGDWPVAILYFSRSYCMQHDRLLAS